MRKKYLDNIRWAAVALVVVYHVFYMYNGVGVLGGVGKITNLSVQYFDIVLYIVYPWIMLILITLMEASLSRRDGKGTPVLFFQPSTDFTDGICFFA